MIKDVHAFSRVIKIDEIAAVADNSRIRNRVEQLPEVGGLINQRTVVADAFEHRVELVVHPDVILIRQPNRFRLEDILFAEIDGIDEIEEAIQLDHRGEFPVIDQYLERIGGVDERDLAIPPDIIEDGQRVAARTELFELVVGVQHIDITEIVDGKIDDILGDLERQREIAHGARLGSGWRL